MLYVFEESCQLLKCTTKTPPIKVEFLKIRDYFRERGLDFDFPGTDKCGLMTFQWAFNSSVKAPNSLGVILFSFLYFLKTSFTVW
jgi:hypothetical protein